MFDFRNGIFKFILFKKKKKTQTQTMDKMTLFIKVCVIIFLKNIPLENLWCERHKLICCYYKPQKGVSFRP